MTDTPQEKFSFSKFFGSFFQLIPWIKDLRTYAGLVIILFIGFTVYRAYFVKTQTQKINVVAQQGSHVVINQPTTKPWWKPTLFTEVYGFTERSDNFRTGLGARGGLRWEF